MRGLVPVNYCFLFLKFFAQTVCFRVHKRFGADSLLFPDRFGPAKMEKWYLLSPSGAVVNACMTSSMYGPTGVIPSGYRWVLESQVPAAALEAYEYWNERP